MDAGDQKQLIKNVKAQIQLLSKPLGLDKLVARGVLVKAGGWYRVRNLTELPAHVSMRITGIQRDSRGIKVKISKRLIRRPSPVA